MAIPNAIGGPEITEAAVRAWLGTMAAPVLDDIRTGDIIRILEEVW